MRSSKYHRFPHGNFIPSHPLMLRSSSKRSKLEKFFCACLRDICEISCHESPQEGEPQLGVANIIDFLMDVVTPRYVLSFTNHMDLKALAEVSKQRRGAFYGFDLCEKPNRPGQSKISLGSACRILCSVRSPRKLIW